MEKLIRMHRYNVAYAILVALALIALPMAMWKYSPANTEKGRVINVVGHNPPGIENAYWSIQGDVWSFTDKKGNRITVKQGEKVNLRITSFDNVHGFVLPHYGIDERIYPGEVKEVSFTADVPGEFVFYCSRYCGDHDHFKMRGTLVVMPR